MSDARLAIAAVNRAFEDAVNRGDIAAACEVYADDARLLPPDHPMLTGRAAIRDFWSSAVPALGVKRVALRTVALDVTGGQAQEIGEAVLDLGGSEARLKYVVLWRRTADGRWQWAVDIWNSGSIA